MPELPEVETTRRGIEPALLGRTVTAVQVRQPALRWPVTASLASQLPGQRLLSVARRAKYLLLGADEGTVLVHLGMSGSLRVVPHAVPPAAHDHLDVVLDDGHCLRLRDPRRFGCVLWLTDAPAEHPLLASLGPEPLSAALTAEFLHARARGRRAPVKTFLMDGRVVAGLGNIYTSEALFRAGIHPLRPSSRISTGRYRDLVRGIRHTLEGAIESGGTSLRDFTRADGTPGYFRQRLLVYGRAGEPCPRCGAPVRSRVIAQRSTFYCPRCQR